MEIFADNFVLIKWPPSMKVALAKYQFVNVIIIYAKKIIIIDE